MDRRSFFRRTLGATVVATTGHLIKLDGETIPTTQLELWGADHDKYSYLLHQALEQAHLGDKQRYLVILPTFSDIKWAVDSVSLPHVDASTQFRYNLLTQTYTLSNWSVVQLGTLMEPNRYNSAEYNGAWVVEPDPNVRNKLFTRVRNPPHIRIWI